MKKFILMMLLVVLFLSACGERNADFVPTEVGQDVMLYSKTAPVLDYDKVKHAIEQKLTVIDFCKMFHIPHYKTFNGVPYVVFNTNDGLRILTFEDTTEEALSISFSFTENQSKVAKLKEGMTVEDAQVADPGGTFIFPEKPGYGGMAHISFHYFESGEAYLIVYFSGAIVKIHKFTI